MTPKQIARRRETISNKFVMWSYELSKLQNICQHPNVMKTHKGDTGNYDPTQDSYWIEFHCPDCGKRWNIPQ